MELKDLLRHVFPVEIVDYFDLISLEELDGVLHFRLDEKNMIPSELSSLDLSPNGFCDESTITDFPLRDKKVILHVRRRRWTDITGKSYSSRWDLTADGTRYSKEFAYFLKETVGYLPHTGPIS